MTRMSQICVHSMKNDASGMTFLQRHTIQKTVFPVAGLGAVSEAEAMSEDMESLSAAMAAFVPSWVLHLRTRPHYTDTFYEGHEGTY